MPLSRFWVGGTGTWDSITTTHWATGSGLGGGASVPGPGDTVTFDALSGGGTVTVAATFNTGNSLAGITCGAFTGTIDWSANNPTVTLTAATGFNGSGTGARTFNGGTGLWTITANQGTTWNMGTTTNLTNPTTAFANTPITFLADPTTAHNLTFAGGGCTYGTVTINGNSNGDGVSFTGNSSFATLVIGAPQAISLAGTSQTVTTLTFTGGSSSALSSVLGTSSGAQATITLTNNSTSANYVAFHAINLAGAGTITATNSWDLGANTGSFTITPPSGGGRFIGG